MRNVQAVRIISFTLFAVGSWCASGGCGDAKPEGGKQVVEDAKVTQSREQMIQDMYKTKAAQPQPKKK